MLSSIELQWLLSFQKIYEQLSIKRASAQLQLPASNVSRHLAQLEQALNVRLLERTTRKMVATAAGKQLYNRLTPLLVAMADALDEVQQNADQVVGHLKMITPDLPFLADIMASFCLQYPQITLSCDTQLNPTEGLLDGFDLVIKFGRGALEDSDWVARELIRWPSVIVAAPSLLARYPRPNSVTALCKAPCITSLSVLQGIPWRFKREGAVHVRSGYKVNSGQMAKAAAVKGLGFAILPLHSCITEIEQNELVVIDLPDQPEDLVLYALYSGQKYTLVKVTAFLDYLQSSLA